VFNYYDELVHLYSKTGQMKRALTLIIDRLRDVHKAIKFAKEQDDADLWDDLLNYSMDKPSFIRGLLEHAGTAFDPIRLVQRIPEGLEIPGLREGLTHMMKEQEIQYSISHGAAKVLSSEVALAQKELRTRQRKAVKFEVVHKSSKHVDVEAKEVPSEGDNVQKMAAEDAEGKDGHDHRKPEPGHCAKCMEPFTEHEMETLLGYACGHVFHLSHLLEMLQRPGRRARDIDLGYKAGAEAARYSVGLKVTRARLLRDRVKAGCPLCHKGD
jgi:vacuolar protein sorting-associated protein 41